MNRMSRMVVYLLCLGVFPALSPAADQASPPPIDALRQRADAGDPDAMVELAKAYFRGTGVPKDAEASAKLLREAAAKGSGEAMDGLGFLYTKGEGVPLDEAKAVEWFQKGADAGWPKAQLHLGLMFRQAKGLPLNNDESLRWIHRAADEGRLLEAKAILGRLYFTGDKLMMPAAAKSLPYLKEAAAEGDPICQNMLGIAVRDGLDGPSDRDRAEEWFRKAALQNDRKAQSNLGHLLGIEVIDNPKRPEALKWILIAKDQGEHLAQKTFNELQDTFPGPMLAIAQKDAKAFAIQHAAKGKKAAATPAP